MSSSNHSKIHHPSSSSEPFRYHPDLFEIPDLDQKIKKEMKKQCPAYGDFLRFLAELRKQDPPNLGHIGVGQLGLMGDTVQDCLDQLGNLVTELNQFKQEFNSQRSSRPWVTHPDRCEQIVEEMKVHWIANHEAKLHRMHTEIKAEQERRLQIEEEHRTRSGPPKRRRSHSP